MKERKKVIKLASELMGYCFNVGMRHIQMDIDNGEDGMVLFISGKTPADISGKVDELRIMLNTPREPQVEEYYWELMGEMDDAEELSLVGMIIDKAEVYYNDGLLEIRVYKNQ